MERERERERDDKECIIENDAKKKTREISRGE